MDLPNSTSPNDTAASAPSIMQPIIGGYLLYLAYQILLSAQAAQDVPLALRWSSAIVFAVVGLFIILRYVSQIAKASRQRKSKWRNH